MLEMHFQLEEKVFYPAVAREFKMMGDSEDLVLQSYEEHALAKMALQNVVKTPPTDKRFVARVRLLDLQLAHHIEDEETILFPKVERMMSTEQTEALGRPARAAGRRHAAAARGRLGGGAQARSRARPRRRRQARSRHRPRRQARACGRHRRRRQARARARRRQRQRRCWQDTSSHPVSAQTRRARRAPEQGRRGLGPPRRARDPRSPSSNGESPPRRGESTLRHS